MTLYNDVLNELQYYILNDNNISKFLEHKIKNTNDPSVNLNISKNTNNNSNDFFFPTLNDSLFWCFYIIKYGLTEYEMMRYKNDIVARQIKIEYIEKIRKEKQLIKTHKFDTFSNIENNLANESILNIKTFLTLCVLENINVLLINNKCYYELLNNELDNIYIISTSNKCTINGDNGNNNKNKYTNKYNKRCYGYKLVTLNDTEVITSSLFKLDNIDKPIKSMSSYKINELIDICNKLSIETKHVNGKNKSKNDLYELLIQYF